MSDFRTHRDVLLVRRSMPTLARTPVLPEEHPKAPFPPNCDIHCPDLLCPLDVDSSRQLRAITGHPPTAWRTSEFDPLLPFKIDVVNEREARESSLWLKAWVAPTAVVPARFGPSVLTVLAGKDCPPKTRACLSKRAPPQIAFDRASRLELADLLNAGCSSYGASCQNLSSKVSLSQRFTVGFL